MKRILCILSSLDAGGAETFLMKIYRTLPPEQYQIDFVVSVPNGCYTEEVLQRGGRIYEIPQRTKNFVGAFRGVKSVVKENGYDTVLKLGENSLSVADLMAAKLGGARVLALRACNAPTGLSLKARLIHRLFRPLLNGTATVKLAPSDLAAAFMFGKKKQVNLLHNGVDLKQYHYDEAGRQRIREEFALGEKTVVGHVGRFQYQKNHAFLIDIFAQIKALRDDAVLVLVGTGDLEPMLREKIREKNLEASVIFTGLRFDVPQLLSAMDVFVFPSFFEGMPNTVIEAQAAGLPCIIADTITHEADITGLVEYLSLEQTAQDWAQKALAAAEKERVDTTGDFLEHGYDMEAVARKFLQLLGC